MYKADNRFAFLALSFSIVAILLCCLGLVGLVAFMVKKKSKEIAVRKIMGATSNSIVMILTQKYARWIIIANIIAWPFAYKIMEKWLNNFAYKTDINWTYFGLAGFITLLFGLLTVSVQTIRAANQNPARILKYE